MSVVLTVSKTLNGSAVADSLSGGGTGVDLGSVVNNQYAPIISKAGNTGKQDIYVRHNATIDPITSFKVYIQQYGTGSGFTYGGAATAAGDFSSLANLGTNSGNSKNNANGLSGGLWMEMDWDVSNSNLFDQSTRPTFVKIFGDNGGTSGDGVSLVSAFTVKADAMVYSNSGTETNGSAQVDGVIGKANDTAKGDNAHMQFRIYLPSAQPDGGVFQWETVFSYSFTA